MRQKLKKKKYISLWGNGKVKRELIFVNDIADACIFFMKNKFKENFINIGSGISKHLRKLIYYEKTKNKNKN